MKIYSIFFFDNSNNVGFTCNGMGNLSKDLNNTNLSDTNYDEDDLDTIILIRLCIVNLKNETHFKKIS